MALDFERVSIGSRYASLLRRLNRLVDYANATEYDGAPLSRDPHFRTRFAQLGMKLETVRLLSYRTAWMIDQGIVPNYESSALKIVATDLIQEVADFGFELLGMYGQLTRRSPFSLLDGEMEQAYRAGIFLRFGGGRERSPARHHRAARLGDAARRRRRPRPPARRGCPLAANCDGARVRGGAKNGGGTLRFPLDRASDNPYNHYPKGN